MLYNVSASSYQIGKYAYMTIKKLTQSPLFSLVGPTLFTLGAALRAGVWRCMRYGRSYVCRNWTKWLKPLRVVTSRSTGTIGRVLCAHIEIILKYFLTFKIFYIFFNGHIGYFSMSMSGCLFLHLFRQNYLTLFGDHMGTIIDLDNAFCLQITVPTNPYRRIWVLHGFAARLIWNE